MGLMDKDPVRPSFMGFKELCPGIQQNSE